MSELKQCPRCGAEAHVVTEDSEPTMFLCEDCGYWLDVSEFETTENAFKWWNDRPFIDALNARIAELEAAQRWHVVDDGDLPEEDTDGNTLMAICRHSGEWVRVPFGAEFADEFVRHYSYWMYAPQPPEVQE